MLGEYGLHLKGPRQRWVEGEAYEHGSPGCRSSGECSSHGCAALALVPSIVDAKGGVFAGWVVVVA